MPGMNGIDFIKEVRNLPGYKFMPILFLTTESQQAKRARGQGRRRLGLAGEAGHGGRTAQHHQARVALITVGSRCPAPFLRRSAVLLAVVGAGRRRGDLFRPRLVRTTVLLPAPRTEPCRRRRAGYAVHRRGRLRRPAARLPRPLSRCRCGGSSSCNHKCARPSTRQRTTPPPGGRRAAADDAPSTTSCAARWR